MANARISRSVRLSKFFIAHPIPRPPPRRARYYRYMTRRSLLFSGIGVASTAIAYPCFCEPRWLEPTRRRVLLSRAPLPGPVRILHLSDLHASFIVPLSHIQNSI